jgi:hypothetical protein
MISKRSRGGAFGLPSEIRTATKPGPELEKHLTLSSTSSASLIGHWND